jgi:hypothetical protein
VFLCFARLRPVSCVLDFASVSGLSILKTQDEDNQNTKTQYNPENIHQNGIVRGFILITLT